LAIDSLLKGGTKRLSFPHAFSGNPGEIAGPPIKTFG
jgi:hypothetical protein